MFPNEPVPVSCLLLGPIITFLNLSAYWLDQILDTFGLGSFGGFLSGLATALADLAQCPS
jgi:hypothetical protein